jgi:hypothetical protein
MKKYFYALFLSVVVLLMLSANIFAQDDVNPGKTEHDRYLENGRFKVDEKYCDKSEGCEERDTTIENRANDVTIPPADPAPEYQRSGNIENKPAHISPQND